MDVATVQAQYDTYTVCASIYPDAGELTVDAETRALLERLADCFDGNGLDESTIRELHRIKAIRMTIRLLINDDPTTPLFLTVSLPFTDPARAQLALASPPFLSRTDSDALARELVDLAGDGEVEAVDNVGYIMDAAQRVLLLGSTLCLPAAVLQTEPEPEAQDPLQRVWFWFPSLSTREKRRDLVTYASRFNLTGFVLAGKPGLLCLEGSAKDAEAYMGAIKSESWGDIPSYQKKVTERYRQSIPARAFEDMQEITHLITQHGARGNRGDMGQVRGWMEARGVGDAWGHVVVNGGSCG